MKPTLDRNQRRAEAQRRLQRDKSVTHGVLDTYNRWGCRCGACRMAYVEWYQIYASSTKKSRARSLPDHLRTICKNVSAEVAALIQEQFNDDTERCGWLNPTDEQMRKGYIPDFAPALIEYMTHYEEEKGLQWAFLP